MTMPANRHSSRLVVESPPDFAQTLPSAKRRSCVGPERLTAQSHAGSSGSPPIASSLHLSPTTRPICDRQFRNGAQSRRRWLSLSSLSRVFSVLTSTTVSVLGPPHPARPSSSARHRPGTPQASPELELLVRPALSMALKATAASAATGAAQLEFAASEQSTPRH